MKYSAPVPITKQGGLFTEPADDFTLTPSPRKKEKRCPRNATPKSSKPGVPFSNG